jgi:hypothetical protein
MDAQLKLSFYIVMKQRAEAEGFVGAGGDQCVMP